LTITSTHAKQAAIQIVLSSLAGFLATLKTTAAQSAVAQRLRAILNRAFAKFMLSPATTPVTKRSPMPSTTSSRSTAARAGISRAATPRREISRRTGSGSSIKTNWRHNAVGLEGEKPREAQSRPRRVFRSRASEISSFPPPRRGGSLGLSGVAAGAVRRRNSQERCRLPWHEPGSGAVGSYWMSPQKMSMFRSCGLVRTTIE
jgi:hypothetical protein